MAFFLIGLKNYTLYPEKHDVCQKSVKNAATRLDGFLKRYNNLRLDLTKEQLLYKGEVVYHESSGDEGLATLFFRDGIQWLQFLEGFELVELNGFFKILKGYKTLQEDTDGDLVTAFWEANFPNLRYRAADIYWKSEPLLDVSLLKTGDPENKADDEPEKEKKSLMGSLAEESIDVLWNLNAHEVKKLKEMISEEEKRDTQLDLLFVIFAIFNGQAHNEDLKLALEFLAGEVKKALARGDFRTVFIQVRGLAGMRQDAQKQNKWARDDLDCFFQKISAQDFLNVVSEPLKSLNMGHPKDIEDFRGFFSLLDPNVVFTLAPLLGNTQSVRIEQEILEIIKLMAKKELRHIEGLLESPDEFLVEKLVSILGQLKGRRPAQILLKMLGHSSDRVRKQAVNQLVPLDSEAITRLFRLVEDSNEEIRHLVLRKFSKTRSEITEELFLDYLEKRKYKITSHQHLLECYRTLGQCGSYRSIEFIQKSLFKHSWFPDFFSIHRRGAVIALTALRTMESKEILQKAAKSFFPAVRFAYGKAMKGSS